MMTMKNEILAWMRARRFNGYFRPGKLAAALKAPRAEIDKELDALALAGLAEKNHARHREFRLKIERPPVAEIDRSDLVRPATPMPWRPLRGYEAGLQRHRALCELSR